MTKQETQKKKQEEKDEDASQEVLAFRKEAEEIMNDKQALATLANYTFNGLEKSNIVQAIIEGRMKGFELDDFFKQNVYAIPFYNKKKKEQEYSLVVSIDYMRKIAAKSGLIGKSEPEFIEREGKDTPEACKVTVWKKDGDERGFTAKVYFDEYVKQYYDKKANKYKTTGIWKDKPRTMIAKVAEMHALRMAFPEELQNHYTKEEVERKPITMDDSDVEVKEKIDNEMKEKIEDIDSLEELNKFYKENKGQGKEFDKLIYDRKKELQNS